MATVARLDHQRPLGHIKLPSVDPVKTRRELRRLRRAERRIFKRSLKMLPGHLDFIQIEASQGHTESLASGLLSGVASAVPVQPSSLVRVFVSSSFSDFKFERNLLFEEVYPRLKELCAGYGLEFSLVDLCWGLKDNVIGHRLIDIRREVIRQCQEQSLGPNFILLLGNRYGYQPVIEQIDSKEFHKIQRLADKTCPSGSKLLTTWYVEDANACPPFYRLQTIDRVREAANQVKAGDVSDEPTNENTDEDTRAEEKPAAVQITVGSAEEPSWPEIEAELHTVLWKTVDSACDLTQLPQARRHVYEIGATEMETVQGIIKPPNAATSACIYVRDLEGVANSVAQTEAEKFIDVTHYEDGSVTANSLNISLTETLKIKALAKLDKGCKSLFRVPWQPPHGFDPEGVEDHKKYLREFGDCVVDHISGLVRTAFKGRTPSVSLASDPLLAEISHHLSLRASLTANFCGRRTELEWIRHWLVNYHNPSPLLVHGFAGVGKSALIGQASALAGSDWLGGKSCVTVVRFLGTSSHCLNITDTLIGLCHQVARAYDLDLDEDRLDVMKNVREYLPVLLKAASLKGGKQRPLLIFLDAIDDLEQEEDVLNLKWLPKALPPNVKMLVSARKEATHVIECARAQEYWRKNMLEVAPVAGDMVGEMVDKFLESKTMKLTDEQHGIVKETVVKTDVPVPLHVQLLFKKIENWASYDTQISLDGCENVESAVSGLFDYLEGQHGFELVRYSVGYITVARNGISYVELEDVLSCNDTVLKEVFGSSGPPNLRVVRCRPLAWIHLLSDMDALLNTAVSEGRLIVRWKNKIYLNIAHNRYIDTDMCVELHQDLAALFRTNQPVHKTFTWDSGSIEDADRLVTLQPLSTKNLRKLQCLPYHLAWALALDTFKEEISCNLNFLKTYLLVYGVRRTIDMLSEMLTALSFVGIEDPEITAISDCLFYSRHLLEDDLDCLPEHLIGQLTGLRDAEKKSCTNVEALCQACREEMQSKIPTHLQPVFACFPTNLGPVKWYQEDITRVWEVSPDEVYLLVSGVSPQGRRILHLVDTDTIACRCSIELAQDPVECLLNKQQTLIFVLDQSSLSAYDAGNGQLVTSFPTLLPDSGALANSCMAVHPSNRGATLAGDACLVFLHNVNLKEGPENTKFVLKKTVQVKNVIRTVALKSMESEKVTLILSVHMGKGDKEITLRSFNADTEENMSCIPLPDIIGPQIPPVVSSHLVPVDGSRVFVLMADGQMCLVDVFACVMVWRHVEEINPVYLPLVTPRLRHVFVDYHKRYALVVTSYGVHTWTRAFSFDEERVVFSETSWKKYETFAAACFMGDRKLVFGSRNGTVAIMNTFKDDHRSEYNLFGLRPQDERPPLRQRLIIFKAHQTGIKFLLARKDFLFSLGEDRTLKAWRIDELAQLQLPRLCAELANHDVQCESVLSTCLTVIGQGVITTSSVVKEWNVDSGNLVRSFRLKWTNQDLLGEYIDDATRTGLTTLPAKPDSEATPVTLLIGQSKKKGIIFAADYPSGVVLGHHPLPHVWCSSKHYPDVLYTVAFKDESETEFRFQGLRLPSMEVAYKYEFRAPHAGIEETTVDMHLTSEDDFAVIRWCRRGSAIFELWAVPLREGVGPDPPSADQVRCGLISCRQTSDHRAQLGIRSKQPVYRQGFSLLPLSPSQVMVGSKGQIPVWDLTTEDCQPPFLPCMEAWMKHAATVTLCQPGQRPPGRRTYDELSLPRTPITALSATGEGGLVASGARDGSIVLWRAREAALERDYDLLRSWGCRCIVRDAHDTEVTCLLLSSDEQLLLSGALDRYLCLISTKNGAILHRIYAHMVVREIHLTPDLDHVIALCSNGTERRVMTFKLVRCGV